MQIKDFIDVIPFPDEPHSLPYTKEVYVISYVSKSGHTPFYVGQTKRFLSRMDDYVWAQFSASTDFKVGRAIRYLKEVGYDVVVGHLPSDRPLEDEAFLIKALQAEGIPLLNDLPGFDYRTSSKDVELAKICKFCSELISKRP